MYICKGLKQNQVRWMWDKSMKESVERILWELTEGSSFQNMTGCQLRENGNPGYKEGQFLNKFG